VTVPEDANPGETYQLTGEADTGNETIPISGDDQIEVVAANVTVAITDSNDPVEAGEPLTATAAIENTGNQTVTQDLAFLFDGGVEAVDENVTLAAGESLTRTFSYETDGVAPGNYEIEVRSADTTATRTVEGTEASEPPTPADPAYSDVAITETATPDTKDELLRVTAVVENTGDETGEQDIEFAFDGTVVDAEKSVTLAGDESTTITFAHDVDGEPGKYEVGVHSADETASTAVKIPKTDSGTECEAPTSSTDCEKPQQEGSKPDTKPDEKEPGDDDAEPNETDDETGSKNASRTDDGGGVDGAPSDDAGDSVPGFGALAGIVALTVAMLGKIQRSDDRQH